MSRTTRSRSLAPLACCAALAGLAAGCGPAAPAGPAPGARIDPCAERLHDVCGGLLLYYAARGRLPGDLAELRAFDPGALPPLVCPASGEPYVYRAAVSPLRGRAEVLVFDAVPCHEGRRWAVVVSLTEADQLTARVVLLPAGQPAEAPAWE